MFDQLDIEACLSDDSSDRISEAIADAQGPPDHFNLNHYYTPVKALNIYSRDDWIIKVRVVKKGELRNWQNDRGEGQVLSLDLIDKDDTLIQATAFNEKAQNISETVE